MAREGMDRVGLGKAGMGGGTARVGTDRRYMMREGKRARMLEVETQEDTTRAPGLGCSYTHSFLPSFASTRQSQIRRHRHAGGTEGSWAEAVRVARLAGEGYIGGKEARWTYEALLLISADVGVLNWVCTSKHECNNPIYCAFYKQFGSDFEGFSKPGPQCPLFVLCICQL